MYTVQKLALAIAPLVLAAQALDVPVACRAMCAPIDALERRCDAPDGANEQADETKCICADTAVVRTVFPLCLDCIRQNPAGANRGDDDDDAEDARDAQAFLARCGAVSSTRYTPAATSVIQSLGASGTPQTTRSGGGAGPTGGAGGSGTGNGTGSGTGSSGSASPTATATASRTTATGGASGVQPFCGVLYVAALFAGGAWMLD